MSGEVFGSAFNPAGWPRAWAFATYIVILWVLWFVAFDVAIQVAGDCDWESNCPDREQVAWGISLLLALFAALVLAPLTAIVAIVWLVRLAIRMLRGGSAAPASAPGGVAAAAVEPAAPGFTAWWLLAVLWFVAFVGILYATTAGCGADGCTQNETAAIIFTGLVGAFSLMLVAPLSTMLVLGWLVRTIGRYLSDRRARTA